MPSTHIEVSGGVIILSTQAHIHSKCLKSLFGFVILAVVGLAGCTTNYPSDPGWPTQRPLGGDLKAYVPPSEAPEIRSEELSLEDPTGSISLREALSLALMKNPGLAAFAWEVRVAEAKTLQAGLLPNPEFSAAIGNYNTTTVGPKLNAAQPTFQVSQLFELGGKRAKRTRLSVLERDLVEWDYEAKRLDILTEVTKAFVEVLAAQERLALAAEQIGLLERSLNSSSEGVKPEKISPIEATKAGILLSNSKIQKEQAKNNLDAARKQLAATWGQKNPAFEKVEGALEEVSQIPSLEDLSGLIAGNPDVARWVKETQQRLADLELQKAKAIPDVTLSGGAQRFSDTSDYGYIFGVSVPLPLFNRNQGNILAAQRKLAKAREDSSDATLKANTSLSDVYRALSSSYTEAINLRNEVLPAAREVFKVYASGFRTGEFKSSEVLDALQTLFETKERYLEALATYHKSVAEVERLIGERLDSAFQGRTRAVGTKENCE